MKQATVWKTQSGYDTVIDDNAGFSLLLETGFNLLTETDFNLLLEDSVVTPKNSTEWSTASKVRSSWAMRDGYSTVQVGSGDMRFTESGDMRITEQDDSRTTELATFSEKPRTEWSE